MPKLHLPTDEDYRETDYPNITTHGIVIIPPSPSTRTKKSLPKTYTRANENQFTLSFEGNHADRFDERIPRKCFIKGKLRFLLDSKETAIALGLPGLVLNGIVFRRTAVTSGIAFSDELKLGLKLGVPMVFFMTEYAFDKKN